MERCPCVVSGSDTSHEARPPASQWPCSGSGSLSLPCIKALQGLRVEPLRLHVPTGPSRCHRCCLCWFHFPSSCSSFTGTLPFTSCLATDHLVVCLGPCGLADIVVLGCNAPLSCVRGSAFSPGHWAPSRSPPCPWDLPVVWRGSGVFWSTFLTLVIQFTPASSCIFLF